jgi:PAS domain S-box-containing protein
MDHDPPHTPHDSQQRDSDGALQDEKRALELLNRTGVALAAELDLDRLVQTVTDAGVEIIGAAFGAFFYTATDDSGAKFILYSLSGAPREAFANFPIPRRTEIFAPTFDGTAVVRSDDITKDPRYGKNDPHRGMPHGHLPVRSYLAVPVVSRSGEVLGGLFFGHGEPGRFTAQSERLIAGIAAQAAISVENARLLQTVRNSEDRFRALIERCADGIAVIDANNKILYLSPAVMAIEGYTAEELIGGNGIDNTHPDDIAVVRDAVVRALDNPGVPIPALWRRRHKDGRWLWLEGVATNLLHDPSVQGIVTNYRDVTMRIQAQDAQTRSQKIEALGTLAGGIAHDFNNILLAIRGNLRLARQDLPADHVSQASLGEIEKAGNRATDLVRRILAFSRSQEVRRVPLHLPHVVTDALTLMRATLPAMIGITTHIDGDIPAVLADSTQIVQVIMNIVTNASHAIGTATGTIEVEVDALTVTDDLAATARELQPGRYARITISDSGCGMDAATMRLIFDPFFTTKPVGSGTGLGLSVVHGIMRAHDGAVTVYSQPGKGTMFRLYFPTTGAAARIACDSVPKTAQGSGQHVLYVDDDEAIVYLATRTLERLGYRVSGFLHPRTAIDAFAKAPNDFDVIVTDLSMPTMSGFELARELHTHRADIPIVMTSGYVRPTDRQAAQELGIEDVILKPNTIEELGTVLSRIFERVTTRK